MSRVLLWRAMNTVILLAGAALFLRLLGAAIRATWPGAAGNLAGWIAAAAGGWLAASAAGAFSPYWVALAVAGTGFAAERLASRPAIRIAGDAAAAGLAGLFSIPPLGVGRTALVLLLFAGTGAVLDRLAERVSPRLRRRTLGTLTVLAFGLGAIYVIPRALEPGRLALFGARFFAALEGTSGIFAGVALPSIAGTERITLGTGAVAWLDRPGSFGPSRCVLLFPGADARGSAQRSAIVLRRTLLAQGFTVLAVDHPGYGESPAPAIDAPIPAWDPLPTAEAALDRLRGEPCVEGLVVVGHSLGATDALRLLANRAAIDGAVILAGHASEPPDENAYWYRRFHTIRGLAARMPIERWREIRDLYYADGNQARLMTSDHPPVLFGMFEEDFPNIVATRDALFALIPGRKTLWTIPSNHYFQSLHALGTVMGDVRAPARAAARIRAFADEAAAEPAARARVCAGASEEMDRRGTVLGPVLEWTLCNPTFAGNPYDISAKAVFRHEETGARIETGLFYDGEARFKFRFTATRPGLWRFTTESNDPDLRDHEGSVLAEAATDEPRRGFLSHFGNRWGYGGTGEAFVPQLVMYAEPDRFRGRETKIDADIATFLEGHGFTGFHVPVFCHWFALGRASCRDVEDPNPDRRTFEALETLIRKVHEAGGHVHLWAWGDEERGQTLKRWGLNGPEDRRLQRYIAARLGPLPGWSMGYGYDLWEWADREALAAWHAFMKAALGWPHLLGGRGPKNEIAEIYEGLDYRGYEQHRPDYAAYVATLDEDPTRPALSEDRFRIRDDPRYADKDYTMEMTRRGLWRSAMAGGVGNIWGNVRDRDMAEGSAPYPRPDWIKTYARFFRDRFEAGLTRCALSEDAFCLGVPGARFLLYAEDADEVRVDLSPFAEVPPAVAVDAKQPYAERDLGRLAPEAQVWQAPYRSDWALAIGAFGGAGAMAATE